MYFSLTDKCFDQAPTKKKVLTMYNEVTTSETAGQGGSPPRPVRLSEDYIDYYDRQR